MKRLLVGLFLAACLISCNKDAEKERVLITEKPQLAEETEIAPDDVPVEELSMDGLVGKWLLLDSEGEVDPSGDYLLIEKDGNEYKGGFLYQGFARKCTLTTDGQNYFVLSETGERYKIGRTESTRGKTHNGIWLALDDIDLGNFQSEDVLKKFDGQE